MIQIDTRNDTNIEMIRKINKLLKEAFKHNSLYIKDFSQSYNPDRTIDINLEYVILPYSKDKKDE